MRLCADPPPRKCDTQMEISFDYGHALQHRPDGSLFFYGFVEPMDMPLLCSVDLPAGYPAQSRDDSLYKGARRMFRAQSCWEPFLSIYSLFFKLADPALGLMTQAEHARLSATLAFFPTTEAEDQALLKRGILTGSPA